MMKYDQACLVYSPVDVVYLMTYLNVVYLQNWVGWIMI